VIHKHKWVGNIDGTLTRNFGQGIGLAFYAKYNQTKGDVVCFISEGEIQAGVDQQARLASAWGLDNLTVILDCNQVQSSRAVTAADPTLEPNANGSFSRLKQIWTGYGWAYEEIDGHNYDQIAQAMAGMGKQKLPYLIVARTTKGKGVDFIERDPVRYSHRMTPEELHRAITTLEEKSPSYSIQEPVRRPFVCKASPLVQRPAPGYDREALPLNAFGEWAAKFRDLNQDKVFILNSDNPLPFDPADPVFTPKTRSQHLQIGVNEKLALNIARGIAAAGGYPIYTTPATHMQVATEDLMHCALANDPVLLVGTFPGVDLSHWGPSHSSNRDMLQFSFAGMNIFQTATADDTWAILNGIYSNPGKFLPSYLRLPSREFMRENNSGLVRAEFDQAFERGYYWFGKPARAAADILFVTSGTSLVECLDASGQLEHLGIESQVVNVLNLTCVNRDSFQKLAQARKIISVIDADPMTLTTLLWKVLAPKDREKVTALGVNDFCEECYSRESVLEAHGIDAKSLVTLAQQVIDAPMRRLARARFSS
jgi:transketolase